MGTVIEILGLKYKINPNDHNPPHVHVEGYRAKVRVNLLTFKVMDEDSDFSKGTLKRIVEFVKLNRDELMDKWSEYHG